MEQNEEKTESWWRPFLRRGRADELGLDSPRDSAGDGEGVGEWR
jgi:hypothetical protein